MPMPDLPSGTVTFLLTDIEGSTKRWEHDPVAMRRAASRHDMLLRQAITDHHGILYKHVGDAVQAAFASPQDALLAEIATSQPVRVPMVEGPPPRRLRTAISRAATSRSTTVETVKGEGFVAVRKVDEPRSRKGKQVSSPEGQRHRGRPPKHREQVAARCKIWPLGRVRG
jgi:hypothetical protein